MSQRIKRINELIKRELGKILLKEKNFYPDTLVTITRVETSTDLRQAKVYISCFPAENSQKILNRLKKSIYSLQQKINKLLKLKFVPKISFLEETKTKEAGEIEEILEKIKNEK